MVQQLLDYWTGAPLVANAFLLLHLLGASAVGLVVGYERTYHGRAAGMRTYTLVCVASTMLTAICGYPAQWFGGHVASPLAADPTRVVQGIVTGVGFLGAGVIMKEGFTIRGLSTAASIWMTSAIGVLIGVGFYGTAMGATVITIAAMTGLGDLEKKLPHQTTLHLTLAYPHDDVPTGEQIRAMMRDYGFEVADWTYDYAQKAGRVRWELVLRADGKGRADALVNDLASSHEVLEFRLAPARA